MYGEDNKTVVFSKVIYEVINMIDGDRKTISYYCGFDKIDGYKNFKETVPADKIIIKELPGFGHIERPQGVRKLNILV